MSQAIDTVVFGGGCFWCTEAVFEQLQGVISVKPGYAGGTTPDPTYEEVCTGETGHAEVIEVRYDPAQITFSNLLAVFFATHDPTTLNRQGADTGTEYRSIILCTTDAQTRDAEGFIEGLNDSIMGGRIVTEVVRLHKFYEAEDYHHEFFRSNPQVPYCQFVVYPKLVKLHKEFNSLLRSKSKTSSKRTAD
jgi:peptide-methionine (S)-S-oxide reductase